MLVRHPVTPCMLVIPPPNNEKILHSRITNICYITYEQILSQDTQTPTQIQKSNVNWGNLPKDIITGCSELKREISPR